MNQYDLIEYKRKGFVSGVLGGLLQLFEKDWDGWGWHVGIAWSKAPGGWHVLESLSYGVSLNFYPNAYLSANTRPHRWLEHTPDPEKAREFLRRYLGKRYDVAIYFWTALQYLVRHYWNRRIPRLLDDRYTCWELAAEFFDCMGKPVHDKYDCPMLPDILETIDR